MPSLSADTAGSPNFDNGPLPEDIVISGFSGRLPESSNMGEFKTNLFDGVDMVNDDPRRWAKGLYDLPTRIGKIKDADIEGFDHKFFNFSSKQVLNMDPQARMLLETTYEAIIDAGINPQHIRGSRTGVYVGVCSSESQQFLCQDQDMIDGYAALGIARSIFANRISYYFDFKGPSCAIDTACSSSLYSFNQAFADIKNGICDMAIVAGTNLLLHPFPSLQLNKLNMLSMEGCCRAFDEKGAGFVRSDGVVSIFLQRAKDARRIYATVLNARNNTDGYTEQGLLYPNGKAQNSLMREAFDEIGLNPIEVSYVEAHGTGTKAGDSEEVNSFTDFFCKDRKTPLLIGSVKSNVGHTEPASGVTGIAKVLIAMEEGIIPKNLHFDFPNTDLYGLVQEKLEVVDKNTPWNGGIVAVNSFGFGGANVHIILKSYPKMKPVPIKDGQAKLVIVSGRTTDAVQKLLEDAEAHKDDEEYRALINGIYTSKIPLHYYRGYTVITDSGAPIREVLECIDSKRPIWFIYSGMGSQWGSMAKDLMHLDIFNKSIHRCAEVLRPVGIDLIEILTRSDQTCFEYILNSFVAIAAIQVALTDLLASLNIVPEGIVGHSVGEVVCAYADGCFTLEQTVLAAYWRGKCVVDTNLPKGLMAAVGLSLEECQKTLPEHVFPACHNSSDNVTISGPYAQINDVVEKFTSSGIFAKVVPTSEYAFHSKYVSDVGPSLLKRLEKLIPQPKNRTSRWISSSIPESEWETPLAKESSADYFVNNMISPVLFHEALQHVPDNAICIEIAPHGLLQAILKRALGESTTNISLVKRGHSDNFEFFLTNVGKLFAAGAQPNVAKLFRPVIFPVCRSTPMLGSKVGWDHTQKWEFPKFGTEHETGVIRIKVDINRDEDAFLMGHKIDGRILYPATGYIVAAWNAFAKNLGSQMLRTPVIMENMQFHRATILNRDDPVKFIIHVQTGTGNFEICEGTSLAFSGKITLADQVEREQLPLEPLEADKSDLPLNKNDFYKELRLRGYDYSGLFQGVHEIDNQGNRGSLEWNNNWISFMDTILQAGVIADDSRQFCLPARIEKIIIDPFKHIEMVEKLTDEEKILPISLYKKLKVVKSGGIEIRGFHATPAPKRPNSRTSPTLERYEFVPLYNTTDLSENMETARLHAIQVAVHLVLENSNGAFKVKVVEITNTENAETLMAQRILNCIENEGTLAGDVIIASTKNIEELEKHFSDDGVRIVAKTIAEGPIEQNCHLVVITDILSELDSEKHTENLLKMLRDEGFLLFDESRSNREKNADKLIERMNLVVVSEQTYDGRVLLLTRVQATVQNRKKVLIELTGKNFEWLEMLKKELAIAQTENKYIYLVSQGEETFGAVGLMNCLRQELGGKHTRMFFIPSKSAEKFSFDSKFYQGQINKDLTCNVLKSTGWGTFRHLKLESSIENAAYTTEYAYVNPTTKGDLSSLKWIQGNSFKLKSVLDTEKYEPCDVYYAPINFRDVMVSSGRIPADSLLQKLAKDECNLGVEFVGRDSKGRRVMGLYVKTLATKVLVEKFILLEIPNSWTMEEASTIPSVYATAYYALILRGQVKKGEKILIHSGAGGVGLAAINLAFYYGLTVFTTVGSQEKRDFLKKMFPQLTDRSIGNSRDTSFEQLVMNETDGKGVDLILNSLADDKLQASLRCLAIQGRFLEIGKYDVYRNTPLGMSVFKPNTTFHGVFMDVILDYDPEQIIGLNDLILEGIKNGAVRPLPITVFDKTEVEQAFRFMTTGKHIGKVVLKIRDEEGPGKLTPTKCLIPATPRAYMNSEKTYIIIGGLGGFGLELANWIVVRGARKLVLTTRDGVKTGYQALMIRRWKSYGVRISIDTKDVTNLMGCTELIKSASQIGPVGGIFNLAVVLKDALVADQTQEDFKAVWSPKVDATKHLDQVSREFCPDLDYFVCFSSISCGRGNIGQSNYGLANSAMERICEARHASGLPGMAIQWGAIGDTGLVHDKMGDNNKIIHGLMLQRMTSCLETLDLFFHQPYPVLASMLVAEKRNLGGMDATIVSRVANILGIRDLKNIQDSIPLVDLGMDSLMATEIKQSLERNYDIILTPEDLRHLTFKTLKDWDDLKSGGTPATAISSSSNQLSPFGEGLRLFFQAELMPTENIIRLKSNATEDSKKLPIFFIHPIEGFAAPFISLAAKLDCPVYCLQCTEEAPLGSLEKLSEFYIKHIKTIQPKGPYLIAGYSFGAIVGYVITTYLEKQGDKVQLLCLDGGPKSISIRTDSYQEKISVPDSAVHLGQVHALAFFCMMLGNLDQHKMIEMLHGIPTLEVKLKKCAELLHAAINQPEDLITKTMISYLYKMFASDKFKPSYKIKNSIILIKPSETYQNQEEDYGLSEVCEKDVKVLTVNGNHQTMLIEDESVSQIAKVLTGLLK